MSFAKQKIINPENVNDGKHILNAFAATCAEPFGDESMGVSELKKLVEFINKNESIFEEWERDDNTFITQWLYVIDCGWK
eukprot:15287030-Ditylum_brightwellii.AAC.1